MKVERRYVEGEPVRLGHMAHARLYAKGNFPQRWGAGRGAWCLKKQGSGQQKTAPTSVSHGVEGVGGGVGTGIRPFK